MLLICLISFLLNFNLPSYVIKNKNCIKTVQQILIAKPEGGGVLPGCIYMPLSFQNPQGPALDPLVA